VKQIFVWIISFTNFVIFAFSIVFTFVLIAVFGQDNNGWIIGATTAVVGVANLVSGMIGLAKNNIVWGILSIAAAIVITFMILQGIISSY
jgi:hypothetical protein